MQGEERLLGLPVGWSDGSKWCLWSPVSKCSIIGLFLHPTTWVRTQQNFTTLIIQKDKQREWQGWQQPVKLEWVHAENLIHARCVGEESSKCSLKDQTKVQHHVLHALLDDGVTACFANNEISPLHNYDGEEEGGMASVLKDLAIVICPFLAIIVLKVVDGLGVPLFANAKEIKGQEPVLTHYNKIGKETSQCLNYADLTIHHGDQLLIHKPVAGWVSGLTLHNVRFCFFIGKGNCRQHISSQVNEEDSDSPEGQRR